MYKYKIHEYTVYPETYFDVQIYTRDHLGVFNHEFNKRRLRRCEIHDYIKKLEMHGIRRYY